MTVAEDRLKKDVKKAFFRQYFDYERDHSRFGRAIGVGVVTPSIVASVVFMAAGLIAVTSGGGVGLLAVAGKVFGVGFGAAMVRAGVASVSASRKLEKEFNKDDALITRYRDQEVIKLYQGRDLKKQQNRIQTVLTVRDIFRRMAQRPGTGTVAKPSVPPMKGPAP